MVWEEVSIVHAYYLLYTQSFQFRENQNKYQSDETVYFILQITIE